MYCCPEIQPIRIFSSCLFQLNEIGNNGIVAVTIVEVFSQWYPFIFIFFPENIPEKLRKRSEAANRNFHNYINTHENFNAKQKWFVETKRRIVLHAPLATRQKI